MTAKGRLKGERNVAQTRSHTRVEEVGARPGVEPEAAPDDELDDVPRTELGRELLEIRRRIVASGQLLLDWDDLEREVAERRGGLYGDAHPDSEDATGTDALLAATGSGDADAGRRADLAAAAEAEIDYVPRTEFGRELLELRRRIIASGQALLTREEFERELAERRGGLYLDDDR